jgi:HD-GYP domain-containing protein (c-di-GMP phosphodiesterase class II)
MREHLPVGALEIGMFVVALDRPWHETTFPSTGFLVADERELVRLASVCSRVSIDRARSLGAHHRSPRAAVAVDTHAPAAAPMTPAPVVLPTPGGATPFLALLKKARESRPAFVDAPVAASVAAPIGEAPFEPAAHASAAAEREIVEARTAILEQLDAVRAHERADLAALAQGITRMQCTLAQRPDPLQWLATTDAGGGAALREHAVEVATHLLVFARHLGLDAATSTRLGLAGLVQDLGKLRLPRDLFRRGAPASPADVETFRGHVQHSLDLLAESGVRDPELVRIVARHHERVDGHGYPGGLAGDEIGLHAEMAGIVDAYCTLVNPRRPGRTLTSQQALERLDGMRGKHFSAGVVDQFLQCIGLYPVGTLVELNTGEIAVVVEQNRVRRARPTVMVLLGPERTVRRTPSTLDLDRDPRTPNGLPYAIAGALASGADVIDPREYYLA